MNNRDFVRNVVTNGVIAALYFTITALTVGISFLGIQFRFAEILVLLCFFNKKYIVGITIGTMLANTLSPITMYWDMLFGTLATVISCLCIMYSKQLLVALIFPIVFNAFIVGAELYYIMQLPFWINVGYVALGQTVVLAIGYIVYMTTMKQPYFQKTIGADQNLEFKF